VERDGNGAVYQDPLEGFDVSGTAKQMLRSMKPATVHDLGRCSIVFVSTYLLTSLTI
jgi:hypothetical protein